jgi:hypothetical protein
VAVGIWTELQEERAMAAARSSGRTTGQPRSDIYTGLLGISLAAMIIGCVLLYLDFSQYGSKKPDAAAVAKPPTSQPAK